MGLSKVGRGNRNVIASVPLSINNNKLMSNLVAGVISVEKWKQWCQNSLNYGGISSLCSLSWNFGHINFMLVMKKKFYCSEKVENIICMYISFILEKQWMGLERKKESFIVIANSDHNSRVSFWNIWCFFLKRINIDPCLQYRWRCTEKRWKNSRRYYFPLC